MDYSIETGFPEKHACGCLILGYFEKRKLPAATQAMDDALDGLISRLLKRDDPAGKPGETLLVNHLPHGKAERLLLVGLGKEGDTTDKDYRKALSAAIKAVKDCGANDALCALTDLEVAQRDSRWKTRQAAIAFEEGLYQFTQCKSGNDSNKPPKLKKTAFLCADRDAAATGLAQGLAIARGMELAKDLANLPGNLCTPAYLAEQAERLAKQHKKLKAKILNEADMEELRMGALLSVSKGSRQPAKLIVLEYKGGDAKAKPVVLVGKGLTFDAGGISLKPAAGMDEMKYDMCGGASVLGLMQMAAELALPMNLVGLVPATENLPGGNANKPGDIVTSMAGITIEILNTDAEGRLILCDTLTYAERYNPELVVDMATLTGACIVALGRQPSGLMGNDDALCDELLKAGDEAGDRAWRMPIWDEYQEQLKSNFADVANIGGPDGGSITAACFLSRFAKKFRWAHLDIAGTAWKTGADKGATGRPVPLIAQFLLNRAK
ncbi:leucyl aminopeptidase [Methylogaea oryzae]|uniref:Probable cytosol aminopeptidase n=1 Tax=Methylogaea oryzae TaxID=1295382 RepID=A0A8D4VMZ8_9GAMM|nr:leucyl aminopeptidase [Methylogaea oryzae]BBL70082.1 putative cytosol aminopeptidase [Methylogaea oryzae]